MVGRVEEGRLIQVHRDRDVHGDPGSAAVSVAAANPRPLASRPSVASISLSSQSVGSGKFPLCLHLPCLRNRNKQEEACEGSTSLLSMRNETLSAAGSAWAPPSLPPSPQPSALHPGLPKPGAAAPCVSHVASLSGRTLPSSSAGGCLGLSPETFGQVTLSCGSG